MNMKMFLDNVLPKFTTYTGFVARLLVVMYIEKLSKGLYKKKVLVDLKKDD